MAIHLRGADDFPHGTIDWLSVGRLGGRMFAADEPRHPGTAPMLPPRAARALEARQAIVSGRRPVAGDSPVSFETLGAVYFILTAGQYVQECPNRTSPQGRHRWRRVPAAGGGGHEQVCDYCGERRTPT